MCELKNRNDPSPAPCHRPLTTSAGGSLKALGLWCGVFPEEAAVGRADRLV